MRKGTALGVVFAIILSGLSGCLIKGWDKNYGHSYTEARGETRSVPVGAKYEASVVPGTELTIALSSQKLCRKATFGQVVDVQDWWRADNSHNLYLIFLSIPLFPISPYLIGSYLYNRHQINKGVQHEVQRATPGSVWASDLESCPGTAPVPAVGRTLQLRVDFANTSVGGLLWTNPVDGQGRYDYGADPVRAKIARIANFCGTATVTAYDATEDPAAVEMGPEVGVSDIEGEVYSRYDTGTPALVKQVTLRPPSPPFTVAADGFASFDGLGQFELQIAQGCYQGAVSECRTREDGNYRPACEESCARERGTLDCLFAARESYARQGTEQKVVEYVEMRKRNCEVALNASPDDEQRCVATCLDNAIAQVCQ